MALIRDRIYILEIDYILKILIEEYSKVSVDKFILRDSISNIIEFIILGILRDDLGYIINSNNVYNFKLKDIRFIRDVLWREINDYVILSDKKYNLRVMVINNHAHIIIGE